MPTFGAKSLTVHKTLHRLLQLLMQRVVTHYDITLLEGHRDELTQNKLYNGGKSELRWPDSRHNTRPSMAVDVAPWPIPEGWGSLTSLTGDARDLAWKERVKFYQMVAVIKHVWIELQTEHAVLEGTLSPSIVEELSWDAHHYRIRFGADWDGDNDYRDQTFDDLVHIEIWPIEQTGAAT